jgi:hypothetical protein
MTVYHPSHFWLLVLIFGTGLVGLGQSAVSTLGLGCCRDWRAGLMFPELVFAPRIPEATFATLPNPRTFGVRVTLGF